jgi:ATP phosphoribosyltransferase regulatory subunit HisZ
MAGRPHREKARAVSFDLADLRGYAYYSGTRFGIYTPGASDWCAAAATTRSAPCSAATGRPSASAWT